MALVSRSKTWITGDVLTASTLNTEFNTPYNAINTYLDSLGTGSLNFATVTRTITITDSNNEFLLVPTKSGSGAGGVMDASDAGTGIMMDLQKTGIGNLMFLNQDANAITLSIDSEQTTTDIVNISAATLTTGNVIDVPDADALTTGTVLNIASNSSDASGRNLVSIVNEHADADATIPLFIRNDGAAHAIEVQGEIVISS